MIRDLTIEQLVTDKNVKDSTQQSNLFNIHRVAYVICCIAIAALVGRTLVGWPSIAKMLLKSGAYQWLCTANELAQHSGNKIVDKMVENAGKIEGCKCLAQDIAVQSLFATGMIAMMAASGFAGILIHYGGARISFIIGTMLLMTGWLFLGYSNVDFRAHEVGIILIALGMDPVLFSLLSSGNLFPGSEMLITALLASATSVSMIITTLLDYAIHYTGINFPTALTIYVIGTHSLMMAFGILFVPPRRFYRQNEIDEALKRVGEFSKLDLHFNVERGLKSPSFSEVGLQDKLSVSETAEHIEPVSITDYSETKPEISNNGAAKMPTIPIFMTFLILVHFVLVIAEGTFIMITMRTLLGQSATNILSFTLPLSFIPCIILGKVADKFDVIYVLWYEVICIILTLIVSVLPLPHVDIVAAVLFALSNACLSGQFWFLIVDIYEPKIQMLMLGILSFISGAGALISRTIYAYVGRSVESIKIGMYAFLGISISQVIIVYLISLRKTQGLSFK
ncbi:transporter, putative [Babesia microti strain RI]|uniref:Transporter, putative n=1 Tax=Babesia microti (strain RI) TaxID=1133968 RepID=I7IQN8_BABMR|nr:transporter, putative [Babesia microti strain RI]CCF73955.1 transporter, putative [Babesia microti strain RI]|eukprot:XP_012648564.1 transporter, putative [Babesia microti strain RI]